MIMKNTKIAEYLKPGCHVHMVGIGGVSMRPLALVLKGMGMQVTGSDMNASGSTRELEEAGMILRQDRNGNRYRAPVKLTAQGILAAQSVAQRAKLAVEQAGMGLEEEQRQIFYQVLSLIAGNLHTICKDGLSK